MYHTNLEFRNRYTFSINLKFKLRHNKIEKSEVKTADSQTSFY